MTIPRGIGYLVTNTNEAHNLLNLIAHPVNARVP
jgi:hypothetical protein